MDSSKLLGDFLRTWRETLAPVRYSSEPGREEVAVLAGISTDSCTRPENGTEFRPSERILGSLVRVLELSPDVTERMRALAGPLSHPLPERNAGVSACLRWLIDSWTDTPALLCDRRMSLLAANHLGTALLDGLEDTDALLGPPPPASPPSDSPTPAPEREPAPASEREPAPASEREPAPERDHLAGAEEASRAVRAVPHHPVLAALVGGLYQQSDPCHRGTPADDAHKVRRLRHREVGEITLTCDVFGVERFPSHQIVVFQAEPGSPSEHALALLGSLAATAP
ncbi:helix-turn-helix transcriptional regulator [Nonomuraea jiangxiensis]|uniref:Helix-turn-helix domain-containing protein n=1 Tax=Nonomuraea jiangxiensis TaxID=633440 RepID=A0A1G8Y2J5_9ACTN|nr:helix-turn-helix transcriptional regulator [Nonomuraea jiangxiensis]SDJ97042.1 Helix-turn-helix domain-containing protein [Nonomuraea jiangxiensis]